MKAVLIAALLGSSLFGADLFPLHEGNNWSYRESRTGGTFTISVGPDVEQNGQTYHTLTGYVPGSVLVRLDDQNRLVYADSDSGQEAVLTYFAPIDSGWWKAPLRMCGEQAQALEQRGTFDGSMGRLNGVVVVNYQILGCADAGDLSEQYAENIGMVRRVTQSFIGPRQYDLVHATVDGIVIDALPFARFTVTVDDTLKATLRVQTNSSTPIKLQFATGQEYDLVLLAGDGSVVWKWSAGAVFVDALHERTVTGEWSTTVAVPRPDAGTYSLQAWLTTIGEKPQFSATIPVTIGQ